MAGATWRDPERVGEWSREAVEIGAGPGVLRLRLSRRLRRHRGAAQGRLRRALRRGRPVRRGRPSAARGRAGERYGLISPILRRISVCSLYSRQRSAAQFVPGGDSRRPRRGPAHRGCGTRDRPLPLSAASCRYFTTGRRRAPWGATKQVTTRRSRRPQPASFAVGVSGNGRVARRLKTSPEHACACPSHQGLRLAGLGHHRLDVPTQERRATIAPSPP